MFAKTYISNTYVDSFVLGLIHKTSKILIKLNLVDLTLIKLSFAVRNSKTRSHVFSQVFSQSCDAQLKNSAGNLHGFVTIFCEN